MDAQQAVNLRSVHDLHVVGDDEFFEPLRNFPGQARLEVQKQFVWQAENVQVAYHFAPGGGQRGVTAGTDGQFFHVIRDLPVQKADAVIANETDSPAKTQIEHPGAFAERGMFGQPVAVIVHNFRAVPVLRNNAAEGGHFGESCAEAVVKFMQEQRSHKIIVASVCDRRIQIIYENNDAHGTPLQSESHCAPAHLLQNGRMNLDALYSELTLKTNAKLALVVLDGLGDIATQEQNYLTPLEAATTPNLDKLCKDSAQGRMIPVAPGITPGSGPGHLGLFGYDPLEFQVGRGVIEALGLGMELKPGDVAARANFCTLDKKGIVTDRRAGRIPTETCEKLCAMLSAKVKKLGDTEIIIKAGKEHRFVVVFRGNGLEGPLTDADPNREGFPIPTVHPRDENNAGQKKMAALITDFYMAALPILAKEKPANGFLMRGIAHQPHIPLFRRTLQVEASVSGGLSDVQGPGATRRHEKD